MRRSKRGGGGKTSEKPPSVLEGTLTATPVSEGIKLSMDMTNVPKGTTMIQIFCGEYGCKWESSWWGDTAYSGPNTVEVIWPFVEAGKEYTFFTAFEGGNAKSNDATVTAAAGIGDITFTNVDNLKLSYNDSNGTIGFNTAPVVQNNTNSKITEKYFHYAFLIGHDWSDSEWITAIDKDTSAPFNLAEECKTNGELPKLSGKLGWVYYIYSTTYNEERFYHVISEPSEPFTFPHLEDPYAITAEPRDNGALLKFKDFPEGTEEFRIYYDSSIVGHYYPEIDFSTDDSGVVSSIKSSKEVLVPSVKTGKTRYTVDFRDNNGDLLAVRSVESTVTRSIYTQRPTLSFNASTGIASLNAEPAFTDSNVHSSYIWVYAEEVASNGDWNYITTGDQVDTLKYDFSRLFEGLANKTAVLFLGQSVEYNGLQWTFRAATYGPFVIPSHF